jgi:hypothetical protein
MRLNSANLSRVTLSLRLMLRAALLADLGLVLEVEVDAELNDPSSPLSYLPPRRLCRGGGSDELLDVLLESSLESLSSEFPLA